MSIEEMHNRFMVSFDSMGYAMSPELTPESIDILLNEAQEEIINEISASGIERTQNITDHLSRLVREYSSSVFTDGTKPFGKVTSLPADYRKMLLERLEVLVPYKIVKKIENGKHYVVVSGSINYAGTSYNKGDKFKGNNVSQYSGNGTVKELISKIIRIKPETRDKYMFVMDNPFKSPDDDFAIRLFNSNNEVEIIVGENVFPVKYIADYIKTPNRMTYGSAYANPVPDVDCELSEVAQNRIIERAVVKATKILRQDLYQVYKIEEINNIKNNNV